MKREIYQTLCLLFHASAAFSQINYNANTTVPAYNGHFSFGVNGGYWGSAWIGKTSDIIFGNPATSQPGIGATGIRYTLNNNFLETWGYDIYDVAYKTDQQLGAYDNALFLEKPAPENHISPQYCQGKDTLMFRDIYLPIWDNNANGTPVNDNNPYALYVYKTVMQYKNYIKFWEIWNEPDFTTSDFGWQDASYPNSWFNKDPEPCDLQNTMSPIYSYNRLLRISYEVIKYVDPTAYVTTGGLGYLSFLDAVLRNTDNPDQGKVTDDYPLKAGAYFDVLSFHDYPQNEVGTTNGHSDGAVAAVVQHKENFQTVLTKYGYDGIKYPKKHFIITEMNVASKSIGGMFGGEQAQINFLLKAPLGLQANQIRQMYVYDLSNGDPASSYSDNYSFMGLYNYLGNAAPYQQVPTSGGIAFKTVSDITYTLTYDPVRTAALNLPSGIAGGAFRGVDGKYTYELWATTTVNNSEEASAVYSFPSNLKIASLEQRNWEFSQTQKVSVVTSQNISLTGTPVFLTEKEILGVNKEVSNSRYSLLVFPNPSQESCTISYQLPEATNVFLSVFNIQGVSVKTLEQGVPKSPGTYAIPIQNIGLPTGSYYVLLSYGNSVQAYPFLILK